MAPFLATLDTSERILSLLVVIGLLGHVTFWIGYVTGYTRGKDVS